MRYVCHVSIPDDLEILEEDLQDLFQETLDDQYGVGETDVDVSCPSKDWCNGDY